MVRELVSGALGHAVRPGCEDRLWQCCRVLQPCLECREVFKIASRLLLPEQGFVQQGYEALAVNLEPIQDLYAVNCIILKA